MKTKGKTKRCKCIEKANKELESMNAAIDALMRFNFDTHEAFQSIPIPLRKRDSNIRKSLPTLFCTFCPICGKRLEDTP